MTDANPPSPSIEAGAPPSPPGVVPQQPQSPPPVIPYVTPYDPAAPGPRINPTAVRLVRWSGILGWGGLGLFFVGGGGGLVASRYVMEMGVIPSFAAAVGLTATVVGAILGQVGRAMQGRVI